MSLLLSCEHRLHIMALNIVILAAGQGKRMHSTIPKVLHRLANKTLLEHVVRTSEQLNPHHPPLIVYGFQGDVVKRSLAHLNVTWVEQPAQLGTGHALQQTLPYIPDQNRVLILYGDVPLISADTLQNLLTTTPEEGLGMVTATLHSPQGLGRIVRDSLNKIMKVVEEKDATENELALQEINAGIYVVPARYLKQWLPRLTQKNAQCEYYLTDIIDMAVQENITIHHVEPLQTEEIMGINHRQQLACAERFYQKREADTLLNQGVTLLDPNRFDVRGNLTVGQDVCIDINVILEGDVIIGNHCTIGPNTILRNVTLEDHVIILANSVLEGAMIRKHSTVGPFARIRPNTVIGPFAEVGNFIEVKNTLIGEGTKAHHVSYLGDSHIGKKVNIGAGTITCNYDGANKHKTVIEDNAFIGSNTEIVAPVIIGEGSTIGAGSTITRNTPPHQLTLSRVEQRSISTWQRKKKEKET